MSGKLSTNWSLLTTWPGRAVWAIDHWVRERQGIYEYTSHAECVLRIQRERAAHAFAFSDGTRVRAGDPIIGLHLWNEHIPPMGRQGPTLAWAQRTLRAVDTSLHELSSFLRRSDEYAEVAAFYGNMCLGTAAQCEQFARIVTHFGFEMVAKGEAGLPGYMHRLGEEIFVAMLSLATNPATLRTALLRRYRERLILSRATLESRYGRLAMASAPAGPSGR